MHQTPIEARAFRAIDTAVAAASAVSVSQQAVTVRKAYRKLDPLDRWALDVGAHVPDEATMVDVTMDLLRRMGPKHKEVRWAK